MTAALGTTDGAWVGDDTTLEHVADDGPESLLSLIVYARRETRVLRLQDDDAFIVGRSEPADVIVEDASLSRQHAAFECRGEKVTVEDLGSTNGVRVFGEPVGRHVLREGEAVQLGGVSVMLHRSIVGSQVQGLETHASFIERTQEEVERARRFGRSLSLVFLRALERDAHVQTFMPRIASGLPAGARASVYGPRSLLVLLAEHTGADAARVAEGWVKSILGGPTLRAGVAAFPEDGASAAALLETARSASRRAKGGVGRRTPDEVDESPVIADPAMETVYDTVKRVAPSALNVLVIGETGTGKELVARALHRQSGARASGAFQAVNCGALTDTLVQSTFFGHLQGAFTGATSDRAGVFETASGGTLFLDEVGELSPAAQASLLRALETGRITRVGGTEEIAVDVRIVSATHRDLEAWAEEGRFRSDLLYRLRGVSLDLPALRDRPSEITPLAERFLAQASKARGEALRFSVGALQRLRAHPWPGNIRELRNAIERAAVIAEGPEVVEDDLPAFARTPKARSTMPELEGGSFKDQVRAYERQLILQALEATQGNQTEAAKRLSMPLRTLVHKIRTYGIKKRFDG
ncbi:MAG: sigma 54-interacting transcriptional regulator [Myxococcota bacterium]